MQGRGLMMRSIMVFMMSLAIAALLMTPETVAAKRDNDRDRIRFYGWVESMPEGLRGTWIIGGQEVTTTPRTEFDQEEGLLKIGGCAKVDIRGGAVHEIDSEPAEDCSSTGRR